jgi:hypothetical protein
MRQFADSGPEVRNSTDIVVSYVGMLRGTLVRSEIYTTPVMDRADISTVY